MSITAKRFVVAATVFTLVAAFVPGVCAQELDTLMKIKPGKSKAITSSAENPNSNLDRIRYIKPGETTVLFDAKGPAVIRHIWLTFNEARPNWLEAGGSARPDEVVLRMYWDDAKEPAVEAPIGDFFGAGFGMRKELKVKDNYLGSFKLAPGKHTLRLECRGKNIMSSGYNVGLDSVRLRERWLKKRKLLG
jgi:hypothetical protein